MLVDVCVWIGYVCMCVIRAIIVCVFHLLKKKEKTCVVTQTYFRYLFNVPSSF
jgi:hypothetical protein